MHAHLTHRPESSHRFMWYLTSSIGIVWRHSWSFCMSLDSNASCIDSGNDSNTSIGSRPPGPILSSLESSTSSPPSPAACRCFSSSSISLRLSTARFSMRLMKPSTASWKPFRCSSSEIRLKNGSTTSRGARLSEPASSVIWDKICDWRATCIIFSWFPFISSSRHESSRYDEAFSWSSTSPFWCIISLQSSIECVSINFSRRSSYSVTKSA
mmetsp:Transcript_14790/g.31027  ORF Transcript_14790/g.31027 Transcript_14790/m.31027 type:complete len:212 (-) Transcript_14790:560-1195(-)